jgi:hypothetical protein
VERPAGTINKSLSSDSHLAAALEVPFFVNRSKEPQPDVVERSGASDVCPLKCLHGNSRQAV